VETLARCGNLDLHRNSVWKPWQGVETLTHIETRCGNLGKVWKPWQGVETLARCGNLDSYRNKV